MFNNYVVLYCIKKGCRNLFKRTIISIPNCTLKHASEYNELKTKLARDEKSKIIKFSVRELSMTDLPKGPVYTINKHK